MKKTFWFMLLLVASFCVFGCQIGRENDKKPTIVDEAKVKEIADKMVMPSKVSEDIKLPKEFTYDDITLSIKWYIYDIDVIDYYGKIRT